MIRQAFSEVFAAVLLALGVVVVLLSGCGLSSRENRQDQCVTQEEAWCTMSLKLEKSAEHPYILAELFVPDDLHHLTSLNSLARTLARDRGVLLVDGAPVNQPAIEYLTREGPNRDIFVSTHGMDPTLSQVRPGVWHVNVPLNKVVVTATSTLVLDPNATLTSRGAFEGVAYGW